MFSLFTNVALSRDHSNLLSSFIHMQLASSWKEYADTAEPLLAWIEKKTDELNGVELSDQTGEMEALLQTLTRDMDSDDWTANAAQKDRAGVLFKAFEVRLYLCSKPMKCKTFGSWRRTGNDLRLGIS